jgi:hypothetical protein
MRQAAKAWLAEEVRRYDLNSESLSAVEEAL